MITTPNKLKQSRRVQTTIDTSHYNSTQKMAHRSKKQKLSVTLLSQFDDIKQKLNFQIKQVPKTRIITQTKDISSIVQKKYRRDMLYYLDSKFDSVYSKINKQKYQKIKEPEPIRQSELLQIRVIFKKYMETVRELRVKQMSEYLFGTILKEMNFIRNLLDQRQTISSLWKQLKQPNIGQTFTYICHLYFHAQTKSTYASLNQERNKLIIDEIEKLFSNQGYNARPQLIANILKIASQIDTQNRRLSLLSNRQNRHTFASFNRSINKKRM